MDELAEMGLTLGADVPVFVRGHAAFAEGVGEILTPVIRQRSGIWWRTWCKYSDTGDF